MKPVIRRGRVENNCAQKPVNVLKGGSFPDLTCSKCCLEFPTQNHISLCSCKSVKACHDCLENTICSKCKSWPPAPTQLSQMREQGLTPYENPFNELLLNKKLSSNASQKSGQNASGSATIITQQESRRVKLIQKFRVVREKILYLIGIPKKYATDEILRSPHFCGQYGTPERIVIN